MRQVRILLVSNHFWNVYINIENNIFKYKETVLGNNLCRKKSAKNAKKSQVVFSFPIIKSITGIFL